MDTQAETSTTTRRRLVVAAVAAAVALGLGAVAHWTAVTSTELDVFTWFNRWPDVLAAPMWVVMQLGSFWGGLTVAVISMILLRGRRAAWAGAVAVLAAWLTAVLLKAWVGRGRPADLLTNVDPHWGQLLHGNGYPSGHSAVAFAVATLLADSLARPWDRVVYVLAAVVALARMVFGAHLPLDVVGGAAVGVAVGQLTRFLVPAAVGSEA